MWYMQSVEKCYDRFSLILRRFYDFLKYFGGFTVFDDPNDALFACVATQGIRYIRCNLIIVQLISVIKEN